MSIRIYGDKEIAIRIKGEISLSRGIDKGTPDEIVERIPYDN